MIFVSETPYQSHNYSCRYFHNLITGLKYLHSIQIAHRDIKWWVSFLTNTGRTLAILKWKLSYWNGRKSQTWGLWSCQKSEKWRIIKNVLWLIWLRSTRIIPTGDARQVLYDSYCMNPIQYESYTYVTYGMCVVHGQMSICRAFKERIWSLSCWYLVMRHCFICDVICRGWFTITSGLTSGRL